MGDAQLLSGHPSVASDSCPLDVAKSPKFRVVCRYEPTTAAAAAGGNQSCRSDALPRRSILHANPRRLRGRDFQDRAGRESARRVGRQRRRQADRQLFFSLDKSIEEKHPRRDQRARGPRNPHAAHRRRRRGGRQLPPRRHEGARTRLRNARGAQSAHHPLLNLGLRIDRPAAGFPRLRSDRARDVGSDERDGHGRERADAGRHRDLRSARWNFLGQWNSARARGAPSRRPRPAGRNVAARINREHAHLVGGIYFETGKTPAPGGNHHPLSSPYGVFKASDRPFNIACGSEAMWQKFVKVIGRPELATDERFKNTGRRIKNRDALTEEINRALAPHPADHWIEVLNREGIPSGPILTIEEMFKHPQTAAREMLLKMPHPELGEFLTTGLAARLEPPRGKAPRPPLVGEHTDEVLAAHGYTREDLRRLRANGTIA